MVVASNLSKHFGPKQALNSLDFSIPAGQMFGLLGPNGAGKTTFFRLVMGILKATTGSITIDGLDAFEDRVEVKRLIGFLPDEPVFYSYLSGRETLELSAQMHGLDAKQTLQELEPLIERMALKESIDRFAEEYSRGMKKKLGLLLALLHKPKLLVLDEPTNGLDVESTRLFYELMRELSASGKTILFSTHLMDQVDHLCSAVAIISRGSLRATGAIADIRRELGGESLSLEEIYLHFTKE